MTSATSKSRGVRKTGLLSTIKKKVVGATSDILSAPAKYKSYKAQKEATEDFNALKSYRAIKGKPIEPFDESNPDFRTTVNAIHAKDRIKRKAGMLAN